jgi:hypothetical protein
MCTALLLYRTTERAKSCSAEQHVERQQTIEEPKNEPE